MDTESFSPTRNTRSISQAISSKSFAKLSPIRIAEIAADLFSNITARDHHRNLSKHRDCFTAKEVTDYLLQSEGAKNRTEAIIIGELLCKMGFLQDVLQKNGFKDGRSLYRFADGAAYDDEEDEKKTPKSSGIALVAHNNMKNVLLQWARDHTDKLSKHTLFATGTTGSLISNATGLDISLLKSDPFGGDQQIGAMIAEENITSLIFFLDPLTAQPHDADVKALLRLAVMCNVPIAMNVATANCMIAN